MLAGTLAGRYRIDARIGSGPSAEVYRGMDLRLDRPVAIKTLGERSPPQRQRFLAEARALARLNHAGIVAVYDAGEDDGRPYIIMELADGRPLQEINPALDLDQRLGVLCEVLAALAYVHERDVLHRDLKPANIVVTALGAKIMDFGLSQRLSDITAVPSAGEVVGTLAYLPPERFLGGPSGVRGDLYSLGIVMYEMFAGVVPFRNDADDVVAIVYAHVHQPPVPPTEHAPHLPQTLERMILRLLAKDPAARYASARELQAELEAFRRLRATARLTGVDHDT